MKQELRPRSTNHLNRAHNSTAHLVKPCKVYTTTHNRNNCRNGTTGLESEGTRQNLLGSIKGLRLVNALPARHIQQTQCMVHSDLVGPCYVRLTSPHLTPATHSARVHKWSHLPGHSVRWQQWRFQSCTHSQQALPLLTVHAVSL